MRVNVCVRASALPFPLFRLLCPSHTLSHLLKALSAAHAFPDGNAIGFAVDMHSFHRDKLECLHALPNKPPGCVTTWRKGGGTSTSEALCPLFLHFFTTSPNSHATALLNPLPFTPPPPPTKKNHSPATHGADIGREQPVLAGTVDQRQCLHAANKRFTKSRAPATNGHLRLWQQRRRRRGQCWYCCLHTTRCLVRLRLCAGAVLFGCFARVAVALALCVEDWLRHSSEGTAPGELSQGVNGAGGGEVCARLGHERVLLKMQPLDVRFVQHSPIEPGVDRVGRGGR